MEAQTGLKRMDSAGSDEEDETDVCAVQSDNTSTFDVEADVGNLGHGALLDLLSNVPVAGKRGGEAPGCSEEVSGTKRKAFEVLGDIQDMDF